MCVIDPRRSLSISAARARFRRSELIERQLRAINASMSITRTCARCDLEIQFAATLCETCGSRELSDSDNAAYGLFAFVVLAVASAAYGAYRISAGDWFATALLGLGTAVFGTKIVVILKRLADKSWRERD